VANEVVGIDIIARLDGFREELAKIPDIGSKEAKQLAAQLSREIKSAERASARAAKAAKSSADAMKAQARAMSALTKAVSLGPIIEGARKLAQAFKAGVDRAVELDNVVGGDLAASLAELKGETGGLADAFIVELTPALLSSVKVLADVANGAKLAAQEFFGLEQEQARARAATEEGNAAIERQADKIEALKRELHDYQTSDSQNATFLKERPAMIAKVTAEIERQIEVQKRLKGELKFGQNLTPSAAGKPAAPGKPARAGKAGPDPAKEAEAQAKRIAAAFGEIKRASEDYAASLAGDEAVIRLEQSRTVEGLQANLAVILDSTMATEEQRIEALATFKAAEVALEEETQIRIRELRKETADQEAFNVAEIGKVHERGNADYLGTLSGMVGAASSLIDVVTQAQIDGAEDGSEAQKKAMREAWEAQTAMALIQAALNIPLSVSNAMATPGVPYPVAAAFGVAAGIASGVAFGAVVAKAAAGPTFHSGTSGFAPDETSARVLRNEAVVTERGVGLLGGRDAIDRANRGEWMAQSATFIMQVNDRTTDVQVSEAIRRPDSPLAVTIAESRPRRVGSARVW
jgi:hypothetical protein